MSDTTLAHGDTNPDINLVVKAVEQFCAFEVLVGEWGSPLGVGLLNINYAIQTSLSIL